VYVKIKVMEWREKRYIFTFEGGGWNTVWAKSLPGARKKAALEYKGREMLVPNLSTVALCNDRVLADAMSTFY
jgi:hypothetical protein